MYKDKNLAKTALEFYDANSHLTKAEIAPKIQHGLQHDNSIILQTESQYIFAWQEDEGWAAHTRSRLDHDIDQPMYTWPSGRTALGRALCRFQTEIGSEMHNRGQLFDPPDPDPDAPMVNIEQAAAVIPRLKDIACFAVLDNNSGDLQMTALDEAESWTADDIEQSFHDDSPGAVKLRRMFTEALLADQRAVYAA